MDNNLAVPVFFCIPDLTGFTKFITSTDAEFSQKVIPNILNKIISSNTLEMSVAEIEGDAVFFYRTGRLPAISKVAKQCKAIIDAFFLVIESYKNTDPKNYEKYLSHNELGIKIIIHFGHITRTKIKGRTKLLGEDVILVHKLLKNTIKEPSYILLTDKYLETLKDKKAVSKWFNWKNLKRGSDKYEHFGVTKYSYISVVDCENINKKRPLLLKN